MGKRLVITEKPSVAQDISAVLGGFEDHTEYLESPEYVVTWAVGHLLELAEPEDYDKALRAWTLQSLPIIPESFRTKPKEGQKKRLDLIKKLGTRADVDSLINACDAGREGEIIFRRIIEFCGLDDRPHQRLWLQSMTADSIRDAFAHLRPGDELAPLGDAAWLRGVGDWLIGMNSTRALTRRLKSRRETGAWSAGRVQTPTLGLLVDRERDILAHEPRPYWEVEATFQHGEQTWTGRFYDASIPDGEDRDLRPTRIFDRARAEAVLAAAQANPNATAWEKRKKSRQSPPLLFDLTTLQREANRRFSFSAKRTLDAAQRLYETHKVLTYPRTDSRHLPSDYGETLNNVLDALTRDADVGRVAERVVREGPQNLQVLLDSTKVSDHFAIVPTGAEPAGALGSDDARIYELVIRQFLAAMMGPATWATVERVVEIPMASGAAPFRTTARTLEVPGFLEAVGLEEGSGTMLPPLVPGADTAQGVAVVVLEATQEEKETKPPSRYSEATLLRLMETAGERLEDEELAEAMKGRGLGTPATRADTIERLIKTAYTRRVDGKFIAPTPKGMRLIDILERAQVPALSSARLTGEWEHRLAQVQAGAMRREESLAQLVQFTRDVTGALAGFDHDTLYASEASLGTCPSCGRGQVVETPWGYRCTRNTQDAEDGCRFFLWKERSGRYIDRKLAERLVRERRSDRVHGFVDRGGRSLEARIVLEPDEDVPGSQHTMKVEYGDGGGELGPEVVGDVLFPCPCGAEDCGGVVETSLRYVCQRVLDGRAKAGPVLPKLVCQREMEQEEAAAYFGPEGRTAFIEGFTSKRNRPFTGLLVRKATGKHGFEFPERPGRARKAAEGDELPTKAKAGAKKAPAKKAGGAAPKKASAKQAASSEEAAPKKASAKKAASSEEAAPKKASSKKAASSDEAAPKKAPAKKPAAKKAASGKAAKKPVKPPPPDFGEVTIIKAPRAGAQPGTPEAQPTVKVRRARGADEG